MQPGPRSSIARCQLWLEERTRVKRVIEAAVAEGKNEEDCVSQWDDSSRYLDFRSSLQQE